VGDMVQTIISKMIDEYKSGKSQRQLGREYNTDHKVIQRILLDHNVTIRPRSALERKISWKTLYNLYWNKNKSIREICKILKAGPHIIKKNLINNYVAIRKQGCYIRGQYIRGQYIRGKYIRGYFMGGYR
jgi:hypothetical protein